MNKSVLLAGSTVAVLCIGSAAFGNAASESKMSSVKVNVTTKELAPLPVNPMIYGNFIESGFGRQVEGMWAEMLFNRSFEPIPPYTQALHNSRGYGPDVDETTLPVWHSGYEEPEWELAPDNPDARWTITAHRNFWSGQHGGWLTNKSETQWAGVAQRGVYLRQGERYVFEGMLRTGHHEWDAAPDDLRIEAELRIYADGDWSKPIAVQPITNISKAFTRCTCAFDNPDFSGRATFSLWVGPGHNLGVDALSLMPTSNLDGWRADVVEVSKQANPRMIRWPGGCYASFYHWREAIGDRSERSPQPSWFWGGIFDNDVGTAEFVRFCQLVDAEPFICVNMLTGDADEAADWVAYCNAPATHYVGRLRARDGFPKPFGVKYWELDNEINRRFSPEQYAQRCKDFAVAMKAVDPTIEIAIVGYDWCRASIGAMLDIAGEHVDYVVDRAIDEKTLRSDLKAIGEYNAKHGTKVRLCNTEWPAPDGDVPATVNRDELEKITTAKGRRRCWYSAMNVAKTLLTFQRLGGDFTFANFNNFANTWGQNILECPKDDAYLSPAGHVFELLSRSPSAWPLTLDVDGADENLVVQAAWDESRSALCLTVLNYGREPTRVAFALDKLGKTFADCTITSLSADSLTAYNTPDNRCVVDRKTSGQVVENPKAFELEVGRYSLTHAVLR